MKTHLRVKIRSLAEEARIIRHEERRALKSATWARTRQQPAELSAAEAEYDSLHHHRTVDVRQEARAALLAYGFLRGRPYREIENSGPLQAHHYVAGRVVGLVAKYGSAPKADASKAVAEWFKPPLIDTPPGSA